MRGFYCSLQTKHTERYIGLFHKKIRDENKEFSFASRLLQIENCTSFIYNFEVLTTQTIHIVVS